MIHLTRATALLICISQTILSQVLHKVESPPPTSVESAIYPVPGCQALRNEEMKLWQYLEAHPELRTLKKSARTTAWNFQLGDKYSWWATNLVPPQSEYSVPSTCRAVGEKYCYVFVEDSLWISGRVNQAAVDSIVAAFESRTPANPQKGIYETDAQTFGDPPDVDNDPRIIILILDIKDGFSGSGGYTAGYFFSLNEYSQQQVDQSLPGRKTNHAEIYYIDGNPGNLTSPTGLLNATSTTAHEFQHMIHWIADADELTFINESCSEVASLVCGYSYTGQSRYTDETDVYLLGWNSTLEDYSRAARWALYLWNQFPNGYLKMLVSNQANGIQGMNNALAQYSTLRRFDDVFVDWLIANQVNDAGVDPKYAYTFSSTLTKPKALSYLDPNTSTVPGAVKRLSADYVAFTRGSNLSITFTSGGPAVQVKAIETGPGGKRVIDVPFNTSFSEPAFGTSYTNITFLILNSSQTTDASYSYQATGISGSAAVELRWDDAEPQGYLGFSATDTLCVTFDGTGGAKLDSIRVALRRKGSISGGVWSVPNGSSPPLGTRLAAMTASISTTPPTPYPVPWPNWASVDLRSFNISAEQSFAVAFVVSDPDTPAIMVTKSLRSLPVHSFTYAHNPSSGTPGWYVYTPPGDNENIWIYLIRAYVSSQVTGVKEVIELTPKVFILNQNYPNPFNPSTTIRYSVPHRDHVRLRVFDMMGRQVATLVDREQPPGLYSVDWHGATDGGETASSGVYFYRLEAAGYHSAQKMVLLR